MSKIKLNDEAVEQLTDEQFEELRRNMTDSINRLMLNRQEAEGRYGAVWDTQQLREKFEVLGFCAPVVVVRRKSDGTHGSLMFQHKPRFYFNFEPTSAEHINFTE